jgi:pimeloyl-ACP methyl ester carboxylesterase
MGMHEEVPDGGEVHSGMAKAADAVHDALVGFVERFPGHRVMITGHSLGAGVATLLFARWKREGLTGERVRCVAFAPPCTVSAELARALPEVISVVNRTDMVPRNGVQAMQDLRDRAIALGENGALTLGELRAREIDPRLLPAGKVLHVVADGKVVVREPTYFSELVLGAGMFNNHMPNVYYDQMLKFGE